MTDTEPDTHHQRYADPEPAPVRGAPTWLVVTSAVVAVVLLTVLALDRVRLGGQVLRSPGSTVDIEPVVEVSGVPSYPSESEIRLVTVRTNFDPSLLELIGGWLDDSIEIEDRDDALGDRTVEEERTLGQEQMARSLDIATRVALERLGYDVITEAGALIMQVAPDTPAEDAVSVGDVVIDADGRAVLTSEDLVDAVQAHEPGDRFAFTVLQADGTTRVEEVVLAEREGNAFLGVSIGTYVDMAELPFELEVDIQRIGGPSAGLALALTVLDVLTEGELTGGLDVVTTGTIDPLGHVGPIGSIEQKSHAVLRGGADLFLVPSNDFETALGVIGDRLDVVGVDTLDDALEALAERGGNVETLDEYVPIS